MLMMVGVVWKSFETSGAATRTEVLVATMTRQFQLTMNRIMYLLQFAIPDSLPTLPSGS